MKDAAAVKEQVSVLPSAGHLLQRKCDCGQHTIGGGTCDGCTKKQQLRRHPAHGHEQTSMTQGVPSVVHEVLRSSGQPLDAATRNFMEPRFGHDFSRVRVHTDTRAADSARAVNALAYTVGRDIVFGVGQYAPKTAAGQRTMAHELTHVVQQNAAVGGVQRLSLQQHSGEEEELEREAERQSAQVMEGRATSPLRVQSRPGVARLQRQADIDQAPPGLPCALVTGASPPPGQEVLFSISSTALTGTQERAVASFASAWVADGSKDAVQVDGYASIDGPQSDNWRLSCERAGAVKNELSRKGVTTTISTVGHGETTDFSATDFAPNRRAIITKLSAPPAKPKTTPTTPETPTTPQTPALCPAVPTTTPSSCTSRNKAYCAAAKCFPTNPWLNCVCVASGEVCRAAEAFTFSGTEGMAIEFCVVAEHRGRHPMVGLTIKEHVKEKGKWFLSTNECIWGHWRAAFEAIHDASRPVPSSLTPEWASAVSICRSSGVGSNDCCRAHVTAEQTAIDHCGSYKSMFGKLPSDVPSSPGCSSIVASFTPPPPFIGDFGKVSDRITYGNKRCCT